MVEVSSPEAPQIVPFGDPMNTIEKINIDSLRVRDRIVAHTASSTYHVAVGKNLHCILSSTNKSTRGGQIILMGGTNADATEYTPNRIFVGGRLAYSFEQESSSLLTTPVIESLVYEQGLF